MAAVMATNKAPSPLPADVAAEFPFSLRTYPLDAGRCAYVDEGRGPTLLFVHGNPTWSFAWRRLIRELSPEFRCLAVDHLGMGLSDKPAGHAYRIGQHIDNLCRFIEGLDLREITLVGHDWGGCLGMGAAARMPERFSRFVMMNTAAFRSQRIPLRIAVCRIPLIGAFCVRGLNLFSLAALRMAVCRRERLTPAVRRGYLLPYDNWAHRRTVHRFIEEIPLSPKHPSYPTLVEVEQGLDQFRERPQLLIWGERDWCFTTEFLEQWKRRWPRAQEVRLPEAGHYLFEDAPERIAAELRKFLA